MFSNIIGCKLDKVETKFVVFSKSTNPDGYIPRVYGIYDSMLDAELSVLNSEVIFEVEYHRSMNKEFYNLNEFIYSKFSLIIDNSVVGVYDTREQIPDKKLVDNNWRVEVTQYYPNIAIIRDKTINNIIN